MVGSGQNPLGLHDAHGFTSRLAAVAEQVALARPRAETPGAGHRLDSEPAQREQQLHAYRAALHVTEYVIFSVADSVGTEYGTVLYGIWQRQRLCGNSARGPRGVQYRQRFISPYSRLLYYYQ